MNISPEAIRQAVLNGAVSHDSYWKYEGTDFRQLKPDKKHQIISINVKNGSRVEYESAREAERQTGIGHTNIMKCCKKVPKYKTAGGYYWYFKGEELVIRKNKTAGIPVVGINVKTGEEAEYESASRAAKTLGISKASITACCKGKRSTAGGYKWRYK